MTMRSRQVLLIALVAFIAALAGVMLGRTLSEQPRESESALHALLHQQITLSPKQQAQVDAIEARFKVRRETSEAAMRAANAQLAEAIQREHGYGPEVANAINHSHDVMGELQKETLEHLFAMRAVLTPEQAMAFDATVTKALTASAR